MNLDTLLELLSDYLNATVGAHEGQRFVQKRVYACEAKLFYDCHWVVVHQRAKELPFLHSGEAALAKYCKATKSVSTCTRNVQIEQCSEQEKIYLRTVEDGFRRSLDSLCDEKLPASAEVWNNCMNLEALKNCTSKIQDPRNFDIKDPYLETCRSVIAIRGFGRVDVLLRSWRLLTSIVFGNTTSRRCRS
ncbi:uncharacterized protein ISCGN_006890 [Ixodes scapularis]